MNEELYNKPERGGKPGVYQIENAEGEKVHIVADSHPMADAYIRMGAAYVSTIEEWRAKKIAERAARLKAEEEAKAKAEAEAKEKAEKEAKAKKEAEEQKLKEEAVKKAKEQAKNATTSSDKKGK